MSQCHYKVNNGLLQIGAQLLCCAYDHVAIYPPKVTKLTRELNNSDTQWRLVGQLVCDKMHVAMDETDRTQIIFAVKGQSDIG